MTEEVINSMIRVIGEIIVLKQKKHKLKNRREWVRKWIQRRDQCGVSNTLINELSIEDPRSLHNFLRINENMFNTLLNKVSLLFL